ncbi:MAG: NUDIX hydrolase [Pyrinomonadaceae bacterium]
MSYRLFGGLWLALPSWMRRFVLRRVQTTFTVSAAAVVVNDERKVLVLHHLLRPITGWGLPGGFIDAGEQAHQAIARELMEETGIAISDIRMLHLKTLGRHVEILFAAKANEAGEILSSEIDQLGWYAFDDIPDRLPTEQRRTVERVLSGEI